MQTLSVLEKLLCHCHSCQQHRGQGHVWLILGEEEITSQGFPLCDLTKIARPIMVPFWDGNCRTPFCPGP